MDSILPSPIPVLFGQSLLIGLSIAAHLKARGVDFRIYGGAMRTWAQAMPPGMLLKSDAFASNLYDPEAAFTLQAYCAEQGLPYHPTGLPVPIETFIAYGHAFQQRFAPDLEDKVDRYRVQLRAYKTATAEATVSALML